MALSLWTRSVLVMSLLFGLLFAIVSVAGYYLDLSFPIILVLTILIALLQYFISPYLADMIFRIRWPKPGEFAEFQQYIKEQCTLHGIKAPRLGVIDDGNPNAYTYGHHAGDARLIVTTGLLKMLNKKEVNAVICHELGHIKHNDFILMTVASTIVLLLYQLFSMLVRSRRSGSGDRNKGGGSLFLIGIAAYVAYIIANYVALLLSRTREYFADQFSAEITQDPNSLSSALVKISYGLAAQTQEQKDDVKIEGARALGIADPFQSKALALTSAALYGSYTKENMAKAMRWDFWNPWALFFELKSTHPITGKRLKALGDEARKMHQVPAMTFDEKQPESYWDEFAVDMLVGSGFLISLIAAAVLFYLYNNLAFSGAAFFTLLGLLGLLRLKFSYDMGFKNYEVFDLVDEVKVSPIRGIPSIVTGTVIGRSIPGIVWDADFVVQDKTGFIVLDYRHPIPFMEFLFGSLRVPDLIGRKVQAKGWYRRGPHPYVEIFELASEDGRKVGTWTYTFNQVVCFVSLAFGLFLFALRFLTL